MKSSAESMDVRMVEAIQMVFKNHQHLSQLFFEESMKKIRFRPDEMRWRAQDMSRREQVLIRIGLDMWSGSGDCKIWELLEVLDKPTFLAVLQGLTTIKGDRTWLYD